MLISEVVHQVFIKWQIAYEDESFNHAAQLSLKVSYTERSYLWLWVRMPHALSNMNKNELEQAPVHNIPAES